MNITESQTADLLHLLRQGASMARELVTLHRLDARFGERLALDYIEATDWLAAGMTHRSKEGDGLSGSIPARFCDAYQFPHVREPGRCRWAPVLSTIREGAPLGFALCNCPASEPPNMHVYIPSRCPPKTLADVLDLAISIVRCEGERRT